MGRFTLNWHSIGVLLLLIPYTLGHLIHFYSDAGDKRCFYKDLHQEVVLVGKFKMEVQDPDTGKYYSPQDKLDTGILIDVEETFDNNHRVVHQRGRSSGQFIFAALDSGEHRICLTPRSFHKKWNFGRHDPNIVKELKFKVARILLEFSIEDGSVFDSKHTRQVNDITDRVKILNDKLSDIKREQLFIRDREEGFRDLSELTNERVVRWSIIQFGALLLIGIYQLFTFQRFFVKEKLS